MSKYHLSSALYHGPGRDGGDVGIIGALGGNAKTSNVLSLVVAPWSAVVGTRTVPPKLHASKTTAAYMEALATEAGHVCGKCALLDPRVAKALAVHACYVQRNFQNAGQPAAICRASIGDPGPVFDVDTFLAMLAAARMSGVDHVRSCVAGDLGMVPEGIAKVLIDLVRLAGGFRWLGYTHQWYRSPWLRSTHMASTQGKASAYRAALARGWRPFHVVPEHSSDIPADLVHCPEQGADLRGDLASCTGCEHKCDGTSSDARGTFIIDHGPGARWRDNAAARAVMGGAS